MNTLGTAARRERPPMPVAFDLREREERLEALKALAGHLVHDFNNFLSPVFGYLTLIKEEKPTPSILGYAKMMETSSRRIEGVMEAALTAARPQRNFRPESTDFKALVEGVVAEWQGTLMPTAKITVKVELASCTLEVDAAQWRQAIGNLLNNARFALVTGGDLEVTLQPRTLSADEMANLGVATTEGFELQFADHGFGMSDATLKRACEPFFSTRPKGQALGLGLTIVHSIVRLHGGQIEIASTEDVGTTVRLWLPTAPASLAGSSAGAMLSRFGAKNAPGKGRKILLVDDDPMVREVIKACLQKEKAEVFVAADGVEATKIFERHHRDLALVLSDVTMPNMGGFELVQRMRAINPKVPVVLFSGDTDFTLQEGLAKLGDGAPELLKKPFAVKGLLEVVRKYLA